MIWMPTLDSTTPVQKEEPLWKRCMSTRMRKDIKHLKTWKFRIQTAEKYMKRNSFLKFPTPPQEKCHIPVQEDIQKIMICKFVFFKAVSLIFYIQYYILKKR